MSPGNGGYPVARFTVWLRTAIQAVSVPLLVTVASPFACAAERTEHFDKDPGWEGHNHRATSPAPRLVRQDFGYSRTTHAGGAEGEIGGLITPAAEPAYYAAKIPAATFDQPLSASGTLACNDRPFHVLVGFFNADTLNEWRTPNSIALRLAGRGEVVYAYVEYATARWRAGGDSPQAFPTVANPKSRRLELKGFATKGAVHRWSLRYDPRANEGHGAITATIDGDRAVCDLAAEHRQDGAQFNRFGLLNVMKSADTGGEIWLDDVSVNGQNYDFSEDPRWDERNNRRSYDSALVRPRFDFGFSATQLAGGEGRGELGGLIFRGDCRYADRMAWYADRLSELTLEKPLVASGKVCLRRAVTDSGVLLGFFNSRESTDINPSQEFGLPRSFFGISTDAPSREGFYFAPVYRLRGDGRSEHAAAGLPHILPDRKTHDWTFAYAPGTGDRDGRMTVTLDRESVTIPVPKTHKTDGTRFDRFGIITTWIDGNSQTIYFDDATYTFRQD
ncbi:MAG: hypothetical protein HYX69_03525 [Planctomycetia bacterium]|nr:hypothetical protein [Planctomycetia bacterium]